MTRPRDPRGASRRGSDHSDLGYSVDVPAPTPQYIPPAQVGIPCVAFVPQLATFSDGTQRVIVPLSDRVIGRVDVGKNGTRRLLVVEVSNG